MKLPSEMVERAAKSLCESIGPEFDAWRWDRTEDGEEHRVQWRIDARAALEDALRECPVVKVRGRVGEPAMINVSHSMVGKRVALVVLDD